MKPLLKKFILLLFIGLISISNFSCECYGTFDDDKEKWTKNNFAKCVNDVFAGADNEKLRAVINDIHKNRQQKQGTHIAIAKMILYYNDGKQEDYIIRLPYVFVSGREATTAKQKLRSWIAKDNKPYFTREMFDKYFRQIKDIKYGEQQYSVSSDQAFAHSERVIGTCILRSDDDNFIKNMLEKDPVSVAIFIKNSSKICDKCQKFFKGECCIDNDNKMYGYDKMKDVKDLLINRVISAVKEDVVTQKSSAINVAKILKECFNDAKCYVIISDDAQNGGEYAYLDDESDNVKISPQTGDD